MSPLVTVFRRDARARAGLWIVGLYVVVAVVGPWFVGDPGALVGRPLQPPSSTHWLGTTGQGQDVLAQLVAGTRHSLLVGLLTGLVVVAFGAVVGVVAGYVGGVVDLVLSWVTQVSLVLPGLPLAIVVAAYLPAGPWTVAAVLVLTGWAWNARVLRSQTLSLRGRDFVVAARVAGDGPARIMATVVAPNLTSLLFAQWMGSVTYAIGAEVGLEFLGLGDVDAVTWGTSLYWAANDAALLTGAWWTFVPAGLASAVFACALVWIGAGLDEVTNPRLQSARPWGRWLRARGVEPNAALQATPVVRDDDRPRSEP
jgi:peptide/nickel transport system permease protein